MDRAFLHWHAGSSSAVGIRNLAVGGEFKLTTSQFGANFFIGNNPSADGTYNSVRNQIGAPQFEGSDALRLAEKALRRAR